MSYRPIRTLLDAANARLCLQITCGGCGRRAIFRASEFRTVCRSNTELANLARRLRCKGLPGHVTGCGHRGAQILPIDWPPVDPAPALPKPVALPAPAGVDAELWARADERERKRLLRNARG